MKKIHKSRRVPGWSALTAALIALVVLTGLGCQPILRPSDDDGGDTDLVVHVSNITLSSTLIASVPGRRENLHATLFPRFANRKDVVWEVTDPFGNIHEHITVVPGEMIELSNGDIAATGEVVIPQGMLVDGHETIHITVRSATNRGVNARAVLDVFSAAPRARHLQFPRSMFWSENMAPHPNPTHLNNASISFVTAVLESNFTQDLSGNWNMGNGIFWLQGTGGGNADDYDSHPGIEGTSFPIVHTIDPEEPYNIGLTPTGGPRLQGAGTGDGWQSAAYGQGPLGNAGNDHEFGHIRTGGLGRIFRIVALERPFAVEVRYRTNTTENPGRYATLRFGDTEGIMVIGQPSPVTPGTTADTGWRSVRFDWDYYRDPNNPDMENNFTDAAGNPVSPSNRVPRDDFVPQVFVEASAALQISDVIIHDLSE